MVERHLPVLIHLSARILTLKRFLSLDRQKKESEDVCWLSCTVMHLKDLTGGIHLDLDFFQYKDLCGKLEYGSQSSQISLHVSLGIVSLFSKHL